MTSAITRAPAGAAHAHGFTKSLKADAPAEGFEALFAAVAGAQSVPAMPPVVADSGRGAEHGKVGEGANDDDKTAPPALLVAASMTFVAPDVQVVDPRTAPASANAQAVSEKAAPTAPRRPATLEIASADSTHPAALPAPASQRIVPNAAFATPGPVAHALIAHKEHAAESPVTQTADPPRATRAPITSETAASPAKREPDPIGAPVPNHAEVKPLSTAPPQQMPVERTRNALSPRALVQAAMVEVVRSPGRGRTPPPEATDADMQEAAPPQPVARTAPVASTPIPLPPIVEQAMIADATQPLVVPPPSAKPGPTSRAAADIARQRQFVLGSGDASSPGSVDSPETVGPTFETLIALGKADGTLEGRAQTAPNGESVAPAATAGAWFANAPASTTQALGSAAAVTTPRVFDQAAWSAALAQQVTASVVAATRETTVRIKPEGLGPIEVRVRIESQHVDVRFAIEHPVTMNMVREALPDLQRMLAQSGLSLGNAEVAQQNAGSRGQAARNEAAASTSDDEPPSAIHAAVEARPRARAGLLDDFV